MPFSSRTMRCDHAAMILFLLKISGSVSTTYRGGARRANCAITRIVHGPAERPTVSVHNPGRLRVRRRSMVRWALPFNPSHCLPVSRICRLLRIWRALVAVTGVEERMVFATN